MYRFLREPRWIALFLLVPVAICLCMWLSDWQWNRHLGRDDANAALSESMGKPTVPLDQVQSVGAALQPSDAWREVTEVGVYDATAQVLVRKRPLNSKNGYWVVTPLITAKGDALLVNRGWVEASGNAKTSPPIPPPPAGKVTISGRIRATEVGPAIEASDIPAGQVTNLDVTKLARLTGKPTYQIYVDLIASEPVQQGDIQTIPAPTIEDGPHLSYSIQWVVLAILFVVGLFLLIRREAIMRKESELGPTSADGDRKQDSEPSQTAR